MYQNVPIYRAIKEYSCSNSVAFHMPGHKLGKSIPQELAENLIHMDLTEIPGTDNLHYPEGPIQEAQELAACAFGADKTFFLVNGSTAGVQAMIMAICKPGTKLIVNRDCHKSVINGMILGSVTPVYIKPTFIEEFGIPSAIDAACIESILRENPDAAGVLITRPNYYGICSDICEIAKIVHSHGKILAVDEAHGAHLKFNSKLPVCAMDGGADICVQSAHKTLPALTQAAYLHVKGNRVDIDRLKFYLSALQTSSPSYILMTSLDAARQMMQSSGPELLESLLKNIDTFKKSVRKSGLEILNGKCVKLGNHDDTRLVINVKSLGKTGYEVDKLLRSKFNIQVEMADFNNIVCISTVADACEDFEKLGSALMEISSNFKNNAPLADIYIANIKIPQTAIDLKNVCNMEGRYIKLKEAAGMISKSIITPYPPGVPVVCPGEIIDEEAILYIKDVVNAGGVVNGLTKDMEIFVAKRAV